MTPKRLAGGWMLTALCLAWAVAAFSDDGGLAPAFVDGVRHYEAGRWEAAAARFSEIADSGVVGGKLYYNLGNAHLKNGDLGRAVMWYLRARKLIPGDPDLAFNLRYALSLVKDRPEAESAAIWDVLFFWRWKLGRRATQQAAIGLNLLFWSIVAYRLARRKPPLNTLNVLVLTVALVFAATAAYNLYDDRCRRAAVILPEAVSVRSGFSKNATELFVLHAGSRVRVEKENGGFARIRFADGKIGWLPRADLGMI